MSSIQKHKRLLLRLAPVLALSALTMLHPASLSIGQSTGRQFARCIVECNSARRQCRSACRVGCREAFGRNRSEFRTCLRSCGADCNDVRRACREECLVVKPPPSNPVP